MKKYDIKKLYMEAQEYEKDLAWLRKRLQAAVNPRDIGRLNADIRAREKRVQGILEKASKYAKDIPVFVVDVELIDGTLTKQVSIPYCDIEEAEIDLLLARDLKGLEYKKLRIIKGKTGHIYQ